MPALIIGKVVDVRVPRVAVLLPVYNGEPHLGDAIRSVLGQSYRDFELIVVDDASTDRSATTIASFRDPRIRVVRHDVNAGLPRSLNRGLALVQTEYVARLDADDLAFADRLERQVAFLDAHPEVGAVGTQGVPIGRRGRRLLRVEWWRREWQRPRDGAALEWYRMFDTPFIHSSVMFRLALVRDELGGYDDSIPIRQDAELWMRVARRARLANLDERLVAMRITPSSMTADFGQQEQRGTREQHVDILHGTMRDVLQRDDVPRRIAEAWIDVTHPAAVVSAEVVRVLRADIEALASGFPPAAVRLHRASLAARIAEKVTPVSRALSLRLLLDVVGLDPMGALRLLPRFAVVFLFGAAPFRWRRAHLWRGRAA
jgi:hypothetical protein